MTSDSNTSAKTGSRVVGHRIAAMLAIVALFAALFGSVGYAASSKKTITLGESLSDAQKQELLDYFGAKSSDKVIKVTAADTEKAMKGIIETAFSGAYSSTALTCRDLGDGLDVSTRNIYVVTPSMFAMALVTAGIGDAKLVVAAPNDAQAQGMTALTGVFKTWAIAPCDSGQTSSARQHLALEELALTADIGSALINVGVPNGVQLASNVVLESQKTIVIEHLAKSNDISDAIQTQETAFGITIPADQRSKLVDLFARLAKQKIDWSTFSAGWTIEYNADNTQIKMRGDGIAIRNARLTATAQAAREMTARAENAMTATAQAKAALTATARARRGEPTPTPLPSTVSGTVTNIGGGKITIDGGSGEPTSYKIKADAKILRGDSAIGLGDVAKGDKVTATIDGGTQIVSMSVNVPSPGMADKFAKFLLFIPVLAMIPVGIVLMSKRPAREPFIVKRVTA
ncbi:MAG: DUF1002 domain-containing protein [Thermomicrobiales bacterium]